MFSELGLHELASVELVRDDPAATGVLQASGFQSSSFGTPAAQVVGVASGFTLTQFGTPNIPGAQLGVASGFLGGGVGSPTVGLAESAAGFVSGGFGTPAVALGGVATSIAPGAVFGTPEGVFVKTAAGFTSTSFGIGSIPLVAGSIAPATVPSPRLVMVRGAESFHPSTVVSPAYYSFNQWLLGAGAHFQARFGPGWVSQAVPVGESYTVRATGFRPTKFGAASVAAPVAQQATGFAVGAYGLPTVRASHGHQSAAGSAALGTPNAVLKGVASGWRSTTIPKPWGSYVRVAASVAPRPRFGTAKAIQPGTYTAYTFRPARFGNPRSSVTFGLPATGWVAAVLGTPLGYSALKARMSSPSARMGRPTLMRTPLC